MKIQPGDLLKPRFNIEEVEYQWVDIGPGAAISWMRDLRPTKALSRADWHLGLQCLQTPDNGNQLRITDTLPIEVQGVPWAIDPHRRGITAQRYYERDRYFLHASDVAYIFRYAEISTRQWRPNGRGRPDGFNMRGQPTILLVLSDFMQAVVKYYDKVACSIRLPAPIIVDENGVPTYKALEETHRQAVSESIDTIDRPGSGAASLPIMEDEENQFVVLKREPQEVS